MDIFSHLVVKFVSFVLRRPKINDKEAEDGHLKNKPLVCPLNHDSYDERMNMIPF